MPKKQLEPLIPIEQFGKLVEKIAKVPKSVVDEDKPKPKRERKSERKKK